MFEAGLPDPTTFPSAELGRLFTDVLEADAAELQYGSPIDGDLGYGNIGLRRLLAQRTLEIDGRTVDHAGVMLTSGGVQGIAEAVAAFLDPGDHAVVEAPTWDYTLRAIQATGAEATAIPIDDDGMQIDLLEQHIAASCRVGRAAEAGLHHRHVQRAHRSLAVGGTAATPRRRSHKSTAS